MDDATKKLFKNFGASHLRNSAPTLDTDCHGRLDATRDLVIDARTGDHGPYLIDEVKEHLTDMDIKIEDLGA
jgi:hypothetical protein